MDNQKDLKKLNELGKMTKEQSLNELIKISEEMHSSKIQSKCLICGYDCGNEHHANNFIEINEAE